MVPTKSVAVQVICAVPESAVTFIVGMVQLTLAGGSTTPASAACCGVPAALSDTLKVAASDPAVSPGVNVTLIVHVAPAATLDPHPFDCENSAAFAPLMLMPDPVRSSAALPVFDRVMADGGEVVPEVTSPKFSEVGLSVAMGAIDTDAAMVKESLTLPVQALESLAVTTIEKVPACVGVPLNTPELKLVPLGNAPASEKTIVPRPPVWRM